MLFVYVGLINIKDLSFRCILSVTCGRTFSLKNYFKKENLPKLIVETIARVVRWMVYVVVVVVVVGLVGR